MQLIVASRNQAKVAELARLASGLADVVPLPIEAVDGEHEPDAEAFDSLIANARAKAVYWSSRLGRAEYVIATDGGLEIPALGNAWNPVKTRRFAGSTASDVSRATALIELASGLQGDDRKILWQEAMVIAREGGVAGEWTAESEPGFLAPDFDPKAIVSGNGFWIPALWICPDFGGKRLSALSEAEKASRVDHWTRLGVNLREFVRANTRESG